MIALPRYPVFFWGGGVSGQACNLRPFADRTAPIPRGIHRLRSGFVALCGPNCPYTPGYTPTSVRFCGPLRTELPLYPWVYTDFGPVLWPFADRTAPIPLGIHRLSAPGQLWMAPRERSQAKRGGLRASITWDRVTMRRFQPDWTRRSPTSARDDWSVVHVTFVNVPSHVERKGWTWARVPASPRGGVGVSPAWRG